MQVSDDPRVGTELAGYRIESLLGWGGMSVVYLAEDLRLKRKVALKLLAAGLAEDESFRDRFLRESELAASIDHPNIVPIYEAGTTEDLLFIAMRYVEGRDLNERLRRGRLDPAEAIGILAQVASALDAAHARGLVHRDVKPSNVLLDTGARPDGSDHVYLADFGLTKRVSEETGVGDDGHLLGTIDYVAPEQIAGEEIDGRADVYSLGCVLYECLVGQPPFRRDSELAVVFAHLEAEPPAPSAERPELPAALDAVIARALAKEPEQRYPSCRELARAALAVAVDEASRGLVDVASRAAAGRSDLSEVEAELAGKVIDLQLAREQARALSGPATPARVAAEGICPFKGLASFEPVDADYFFGRERLVAELVARLVGAGFLGIVGPSGSGKSSVLRAGLLPALAGGVLPGSEGWRRLLLRPGERPLDELRRVLVSGAKDPLAEALDALPAGARLLLAVDQLEELFTACRSEAERAAFADTPRPRGRRSATVERSSWSRCAPTSTAASRRTRRSPSCWARTTCWSGRCRPRSCGAPSSCPPAGWACGSSRSWPTRWSTTSRASRARCRCCPPPCSSSGRSGRTTRSLWLPTASPAASTAPSRGWPRARTPGSRTSASRSCAPSCCAWSARARATRRCAAAPRSPSSTSSATRTWPTCSRRWPTAVSSPCRKGTSRSPTRRCCANGRACASGSRRTPKGAGFAVTSPRRRPSGTRPGAIRASSTAAPASRPPSTGPPITRSTSTSSSASSSPRAARRRSRRRSASAHQPAPARPARRGRGPARRGRRRAGSSPSIQRGEARDAETAQLAQRLGAQALVEEDLDLSLLLARQAVAIDDSPQTRGYLLAALLRAPKAVGIMHGRRRACSAGIASAPTGGRWPCASTARILFFDARTYAQIGGPRC